MMKHFMPCVRSVLRECLHSVVRLVGFGAGWAAILLVSNDAFSAQQGNNGLLRMETGRAIFSNPAYERLCQEKLFVTSGEVARYFFVPVFKDPETLVSIYRARQSAGSLPGNYWVTVTRPTRRIGGLLTDPDGRLSDANAIKVERRNAPIPESTVHEIHRVWLAMLEGAGTRTRLDMQIDSDAMFFYATDAAGKTLRAERFGTGENVFALVEIGNLLIWYGYGSDRERATRAREIEAKASALSKQLR
jgi:hypothetical protein